MISASPSGAAAAIVGRARLLTVDGGIRKGLDTGDDEEGRADGIAENGKSRINVDVICSACIVVWRNATRNEGDRKKIEAIYGRKFLVHVSDMMRHSFPCG